MVTSPAGEIPAPEEGFLTCTGTIFLFHAASATFETGELQELQLPFPVSPHRHCDTAGHCVAMPTPCHGPCMVACCNRQGQGGGSRHPGSRGSPSSQDIICSCLTGWKTEAPSTPHFLPCSEEFTFVQHIRAAPDSLFDPFPCLEIMLCISNLANGSC